MLCAVAAHAEDKRTVAVLEYRAGARGARDIGMRLARLLRETAALNVIDLAEARRKLPRVDGEVAKCGGEAMCVGAIGEQLGANEVLLVGVSQLGDVILALQRIDEARRSGRAPGRVAAAGQGDLGRDGARLAAPALPARDVQPLRLDRRRRRSAGRGGDAERRGGGQDAAARAVKVRAPATYKLKVEKSGFVPFQARVDVLPDANVEVHATLVKESREQAWYKRWYVWAIVGGAIAAGGAATAIYFGTRTESTPLGYVQKPTP